MRSLSVLACVSLVGLSAAVPLEKRDQVTVVATATVLKTEVQTTTVYCKPDDPRLLAQNLAQHPFLGSEAKATGPAVVPPPAVDTKAGDNKKSKPEHKAAQVEHYKAPKPVVHKEKPVEHQQPPTQPPVNAEAYQQKQQEHQQQQEQKQQQQQQKQKQQEQKQQQQQQQAPAPAPVPKPQEKPAQPAIKPVDKAVAPSVPKDQSTSSGGKCGDQGGMCSATRATTFNEGGNGGAPGSCGWMDDKLGEDYFAMSHLLMGPGTSFGVDKPANPNCGRKAVFMANGQEYEAVMVDKCPTCDGSAENVDMSLSLFKKVFNGQTTGAFPVKWKFTDGMKSYSA